MAWQNPLSTGDEPRPTARARPDRLADLVAFWDFQEPAGQARQSTGGPVPLTLREAAGPVERVAGGLFGPHAARIEQGLWLMIPRAEVGGLDIHGPAAQITVVAWIQRVATTPWQTIAGIWGETQATRQYCLFLNAPRGTKADEMQRYPMTDRIHGHVSAVGGPTPGHKYCITYASGATPIPFDRWVCIAMSYDGRYSRVFVDGRLDAREQYNPFPYPYGLYDGGSNGAPFTVGAVHRHGAWGNFFGGLLGGLAVYRRALSEAELSRIAPRAPTTATDAPASRMRTTATESDHG